MNAMIYPWEAFLPKTQQWHRVGGGKPHDPDARFVYIDARAAPLRILGIFKNLQGVWVGRATESDLEQFAQFPSLTVVRLVAPRITSLAPLQHLPNLEALNLEDPPTVSGLDRLANLRCLALRHFPRIKSLAPAAALTRLRAISLSTIPSWDASRRCLEVESRDPFRKLTGLESLSLMGVWPLDARLDPLHGLANLKYLHISHVYGFKLEDYAALRRALPKASGHCLEPYFTLPQLNLRCKRCGEEMVFLTGPRPRARRQLCPQCHREKLQEHVQQWSAAVQGG
jgi:hypothetical protein